MLTQHCLPTPMKSAVKSLLFMHTYPSPVSLAARLHQYHANQEWGWKETLLWVMGVPCCMQIMFCFCFCLIPSPFFIKSPKISPLWQLLVCSMPLFLFCSSVYVVHYFPHISEIMWYFSFSDLFILLRFITFRSIDAITKGKFSFLWQNSIPLSKCTTAFWSTHLLMGTRAASRSWLL